MAAFGSRCASRNSWAVQARVGGMAAERATNAFHCSIEPISFARRRNIRQVQSVFLLSNHVGHQVANFCRLIFYCDRSRVPPSRRCIASRPASMPTTIACGQGQSRLRDAKWSSKGQQTSTQFYWQTKAKLEWNEAPRHPRSIGASSYSPVSQSSKGGGPIFRTASLPMRLNTFMRRKRRVRLLLSSIFR